MPVAARALQTVALCHGVAVLRDGLCAFGVFLGACLRACVVEVFGLFPARNYGALFTSAFWFSRLACGVHLLRQGTRGPGVACVEADGSRLLATCSLCCESPGALAAVSLALCAESVVGVAVWSRMIRRRREKAFAQLAALCDGVARV